MLQPEVAISAIFNEREAIVKNDAFISFKNTPTHSTTRIELPARKTMILAPFARDVTNLREFTVFATVHTRTTQKRTILPDICRFIRTYAI